MGAFGANVTMMLSSNETTSVNTASKKEKFYSIINSLRPIIGDDLLKERLELETLESLKLIAKKELFNQKYIKIKTRLFYKQQKFNLLREESEGYSKLIAELGQSTLDSKVLENIQSLIGCFNLDPNRVLDIILESFENSPTMFKTFIGLLKHYKAEDDTICQIIGFKYQSLYQQQVKSSSSNANDANNDLDNNNNSANYICLDSLYKITSHLLKHNVIDLDTLMPHLYPNEQQIQQSYKEEFDSARQYAKKLNSINLADTANQMDTSSSGGPASSHQDEKSSQSSKIDNQKVHLVKNLIEIGDYKTALRIIEKLPPWYIASYNDITISICRSIDVSLIDPIYKNYNLLSKYLKDKYLRSSNKSKSMETDDSLSEMDDVLGTFVDVILPILSSLGPGISYDSILFTKLIRICVSFLDMKKFSSASSFNSLESQLAANSDNYQKEFTPPPQTQQHGDLESHENLGCAQILATLSKSELTFYNQIYTLLNEVLMPSLSMISMNPCLAIELWNLLKLFPYEMRYHLYNNWRMFTYKHFPKLIRTKAECTEKIKYLLKRLTKENVKIHGRQIGKLSHNNPIIVCDYILTQIQRYDNFILPVVDSLKFMTPLSYDVLSYCIIIAMSDADKEKMKHDSTNLSTWLQSIATFCALTFKKYPIELIAMIQYVINQLKNRKSYDLLILQEIVQKMCGIEVLSEVNDLQLEAMAGGDILRQEAGYFNPIRNIKKCANRLKEALADHCLILPLCILLSQQRDYIVFADQAERERESMMPASEKRHLKLTGCLYDQCQDSLVQFSQFLSSTLTTEEYIHIFPKIDVLVNEYHVSPDVAFFLSRPMYAHHIQSKYDELRRTDRSIKTTEKPSKTQRYLEAIDVVMQPVIDLARSLHPPKIWEDMSPLFYTTFWTLSMSDCFVPSNAYDKQRQSLKQKLNSLDDNLELTATKRKKEKEKLIIMLDKLSEEENKQKDHVSHVKARFEKEKDFWFPQKNRTKNETITVFLQLCIFSRCLFTQIDAYYCSKFIQIIHSLKTPNFSTIICYDRIFSDISYSIASLTDNEARRYGRFLLGLLETVMNWHADPNTFENECAQYPGFLTVVRNATAVPSNTTSSTTGNQNRLEQLDYENFRHVCHKWHYKLTKSFIVCIESKEYLQMRNALIILTKILPHYPKLTNFAAALEKRVDIIKQTEKEKRQDIYTLASAYLGQLKQRKSHLVDESKFHIKKQVTPSPSPVPLSNQQPTKTQQSSKSTSSSTSTSQQFKQPQNPSKQQSSSSSSSQPSAKTSSSSSSNLSTTSQSSSSSSKSNAPVSGTSSNNSSETSSKSSSSSSSTSSKHSDSKSNSSKENRENNKENSKEYTKEVVSKDNIKKENDYKENSTNQSSLNNETVAAIVTNSVPVISTSNNNSAVMSNSSSRIVIKSESPPSSQSIKSEQNSNHRESSKEEKHHHHYHNQSSSTTNGASSSSRSSSKRSSPSNSNNLQQLTPTKNGNEVNHKANEYSPTSSVSSDELPNTNASNDSPRRSVHLSQDGQQHSSSSHHRHNHSRSTSPSGPSNKQSSSNGSYYRSSTSDKSKRSKLSSDESANGRSGSSYNNDYNSLPTSQSSGSSQQSSNGDRSSSKRKSSRERSERSDKEKKEHRKREHSTELSADVQHKRSKSDEAKKKSSSSSSSSSSQMQQQQSMQQMPSSTSSSSSSSKSRSTKKHESSSSSSYNNGSKDDYSPNSSQSMNQILLNSSSSSQLKSSSSYRDERRSAHDKNPYSSSSSYKDKK